MNLNEYTSFLKDCSIPDNNSEFCRASDLDTLFIATNYEEVKTGLLAAENDDLALMHFEFFEMLVRVCVAKYVKAGVTDDVSEVTYYSTCYEVHVLQYYT